MSDKYIDLFHDITFFLDVPVLLWLLNAAFYFLQGNSVYYYNIRYINMWPSLWKSS